MTERVLLHICCGPCALYPVAALRGENFELTGFYYNPNIHPYQEYLKRRGALEDVVRKFDLRMVWEDDYHALDYFRAVSFREEQRCRICYWLRFSETARLAHKEKFDYFTSTIFYSRFQKHELAKEIAEAVAKEHNVKFLYRDFRTGWKQGIEQSLALGIYRQKYCGCIYSEYERFHKKKTLSQEGVG